MLTRAKQLWAMGMVLVLCLAAACAVRLGGGGGVPPFVSFDLGGRTFTISFGPVGQIRTRANETVQQAGEVTLFEETPTDAPVAGQMRLLGSNVTVTPLDIAQKRAQGTPVNGSATVHFLIAPGTSTNPCGEGTFLAEYDLTVTDGNVTILNEVYELSAEALGLVFENDVTMCVEVTADFDGQLVMQQFELSFSDETAGPTGETTTAHFTFLNQDGENIHILLPGDDFSDDNRIDPGGTKTARIFDAQIGLGVVISAGRNGEILATTDCPTITHTDYHATVVWDGVALTCEAEQWDTGDIIQVPIDRNGDAALVTDTINGVDYAIIGVMDVNSPETGPPSYAQTVTVDLGQLGLQYVETIYLATHSSHAWDIPNGVKVATFTCEYAEGGSPTTLDMVMGTNTAEWAFENPTQFEFMGGPVSHTQPTILTSAPTTQGSTEEYDGHDFAASVSLDSTRTLAVMNLDLEDAEEIAQTRTPPNPDFFLLSQAHMGITLEGPAGTPAGDTDAATEEKVPAQVILSVTVLGSDGNPLSGVTVNFEAHKRTDDGEVTGTDLTTANITDANGQCTGQVGYNLGGPDGEFARVTASVTVDGTTYSEYSEFYIDSTLPVDQEQQLTQAVTIDLSGGDGSGGTGSAGALAGCWQVTVNSEDEEDSAPTVLVFDIDSDGNLATLWIEVESGDPPETQLMEFVRFTSPNAGLLGAVISDAQQEISVNATGTEADFSVSFTLQVDEDTSFMAMDISDAALSGDPPSSFHSDSVSGSSDADAAPPADGQRTECPDASSEDVISQEELEFDSDFELCGSGTGLMMPLTFLALGWIKLRR